MGKIMGSKYKDFSAQARSFVLFNRAFNPNTQTGNVGNSLEHFPTI